MVNKIPMLKRGRKEIIILSKEGYIESVEDINKHYFLLGLEWHPEDMFDDKYCKKIFDVFVNSSKNFHNKKRL